MSKSNAFETDLLSLIFNNVAIAGLGDAGGLLPSAAAGNLYVALHTADPGEAGTQATSECAYTGYARVAVPRASAGWVVTGDHVSPAVTISFPVCTAGAETASFFSVGLASSGAGKILYSGAISPTVGIASGIVPQITTASTITED